MITIWHTNRDFPELVLAGILKSEFFVFWRLAQRWLKMTEI